MVISDLDFFTVFSTQTPQHRLQFLRSLKGTNAAPLEAHFRQIITSERSIAALASLTAGNPSVDFGFRNMRGVHQSTLSEVSYAQCFTFS